MATKKIIIELTALEHEVLARAALSIVDDGYSMFKTRSERVAYHRVADKLYRTRPK